MLFRSDSFGDLVVENILVNGTLSGGSPVNVDGINLINGSSLVGVVKSNFINVFTNLTITDIDGYSSVFVETGGSNQTITLPLSSSNEGRTIALKKTDSGSGFLVIDGTGAETIDGVSAIYLPSQYDSVELQSDGISWQIINQSYDDLSLYGLTTPDDIANNTFVDFNKIGRAHV